MIVTKTLQPGFVAKKAAERRRSHQQINDLIFATSARGDKVVAYPIEGEPMSLMLPASREAPLELGFVAGSGTVALRIKGMQIARIASLPLTTTSGTQWTCASR